MPFGIDSAGRGAPPMMYWPALASLFLWVSNGKGTYLFSSGILIITGGISFVCASRLWSVHQQDDYDIRGEFDPDQISNGGLRNFIEGSNPLAAAALPQNSVNIVVALVSLGVTIISGCLLWAKYNFYISQQSNPMFGLVVLGILPYLYLGTIIGTLVFYFDG